MYSIMSKMNTARREPTSDWKNHLTTLRSVSEDICHVLYNYLFQIKFHKGDCRVVKKISHQIFLNSKGFFKYINSYSIKIKFIYSSFEFCTFFFYHTHVFIYSSPSYYKETKIVHVSKWPQPSSSFNINI